MTEKSIDTLQGLVVLLAIPLGVIPLGQRLFDAEQGFVFRKLFGELTDPVAWVVPLAVLGVAALVVTLLEVYKKRSS